MSRLLQSIRVAGRQFLLIGALAVAGLGTLAAGDCDLDIDVDDDDGFRLDFDDDDDFFHF
jgi:hypothetical protein